MAEQTIQSIAEEAAEQQRLADAESLRSFIGQWDMENMPACPAGMALLHDFANASPGAYEIARKRNFIDPPMIGNNPRWLAFADHVNTCRACKER